MLPPSKSDYRSIRLAALLRFLPAIVLLFCTPGEALSQWLQEQRLTVDPDSSFISYSTQKSIAMNGNNLHIVWRDNRDGNREIYYKRSTDAGESWLPDVRLTNDPGMSGTPGIAVVGSTVHVSWNDDRDGNNEIYYKRSTDGGATWDADLRLTSDTAFSNMASISANDSDVYVAWADRREGRPQVYWKHSTDRGVTWGQDVKLAASQMFAYNPSILATDSLLQLVWNDSREGVTEVYYKRSRNKGEVWSMDERLSETSNNSQIPSIAASGTNVHVVWTDSRGGTTVIYHTRSTNSGMHWQLPTKLTSSAGSALWASVACSGMMVHAVWPDDREGSFNIYYRRSTDAGVTWERDMRISDNGAARSEQPSVAVSDSAAHVLWMDTRDGPNGEMYYTRNPTANIIIPTGITTAAPVSAALKGSYPNPLQSRSTISYSVNRASHVTLTVHDMLGRCASRLVDTYQSAGDYGIPFDASSLPPGMYWCRLTSEGSVMSTRLIVLK